MVRFISLALSATAILLTGCQQLYVLPEETVLPAPASLTSTSLDGAIALRWADTPYLTYPQFFRWYRIYSRPYDLDGDRCLGTWEAEGTTVAPEFVVGALTNGAPRCFSVTAESTSGLESQRSPIRFDTPRYEATAVAIYARQADVTRSGFRFWSDYNGDGWATRSELGLVMSGNGVVDFVLERDGAGRLYLTPSRAGVDIALYGDRPIGSLTDIDLAPVTGYATSGIEAVAGWGYVVQMRGSDGFKRFGALRVVYAGSSYVLVDWAFQSDPGNPELLRAPE